MLHPLLHLLVHRGPLLAGHLQAYAELAAEEADRLAGQCRRQALLLSGALCGGAVAAALGGTAALLWAVLPPAQIHAPWVLWLVPLMPLALALACLAAAHARHAEPAFAGLRQQVQIDLLLLQAAARP
jgi:hypothetical protein